ncbi:MAG TPA: lysozyme inhibitor LprI family protein [Pyrinomonadaceae bacterium]|nr:lysozyme inhibitor LprI family protein [Pyrinomonadaceae bacterium]
MSRKFGAGVFALLLALFCAGASQAQEATKPAPQEVKTAKTDAVSAEQDDVDDEDPCPGEHTQFELNQCAARARDKADAELNKVYRELMKDAGTTERAKLRAAQLAWLKFRDAHCDYESVGNKGGSIYPMVVSFCLAGVTNARVKQLQEILRESREQ